jgi:hypothetical protein
MTQPLTNMRAAAEILEAANANDQPVEEVYVLTMTRGVPTIGYAYGGPLTEKDAHMMIDGLLAAVEGVENGEDIGRLVRRSMGT